MVTNYQVEALVLSSKDFGERDVMLTALSKERGKISLLCKGVKKPASSLRATAQLFSHSKFFYYEGKSIPVATQAQLIKNFSSLSTDLNKFAAAAYWSEMVDHLLPEKENNFHAFNLLLKSLNLLNQGFSWPLFYAFQVKLLTITGFQPQVENCIACGRELGERKYFAIQEGGTVCTACSQGNRPVYEGTIQCIRLFKRAPLETILKLNVSGGILKQLSKLMLHYVEYHTEQKMRSVEFLNSLE